VADLEKVDARGSPSKVEDRHQMRNRQSLFRFWLADWSPRLALVILAQAA
jgi:hypothetical protein